MASTSALKTAKKELRTLMKQKLKDVTQDSVNSQSACQTLSVFKPNSFVGAALFKSITNFKPYQNAKRIGIYLSMPSGEIQTDAIVCHALKSGKQVFVPFLHKSRSPSPDTPKSVMDMVDIRSLHDYESLQRDSWGIPTIDSTTAEEREHILETATGATGKLDIIFMPGVAFELDSASTFVKRLGHGKGFYDFFLHRYLEGRGIPAKALSLGPGTDALLYGLALEEQLLHSGTQLSVPTGEYDHLLHGLLVGNGAVIGERV
jgi:5-formyltetrahydrofolate cyclo-ligase